MATALPLPPPPPARPWMTLYGTRVGSHPGDPDAGEGAGPPPPALAPIQAGLLGDDLLAIVFSHLPPPSLAAAACACRAWRAAIASTDGLWRSALLTALGPAAAPPRPPGLSWRDVFLSAPRLRTDGLYVSRNTYIRTGLVEWRTRNPVHLVTYFRYWRFFDPPVSGGGGGGGGGGGAGAGARGEAGETGEAGPSAGTATPPTPSPTPAILQPDDEAALPRRPPGPPARCARGGFWYRTTPDPPIKAARSLALGPRGGTPDCARVMEGRWRLRCPPWEGRAVAARSGPASPATAAASRTERVATVAAAMAYGNTADTEVRARLGLRSTVPGACNRLDVLDLVSHDRATGVETDMLGGGGEETDAEEGWARGRGGAGGGGGAPGGGRRLQHRRGLATFVFIPWAEVASSQLNLPLSELDVFIPG